MNLNKILKDTFGLLESPSEGEILVACQSRYYAILWISRNKYHINKNITFLSINKVDKIYLELFRKKYGTKIITKEELLERKVQMKYDYIIGNPPYQYPKVGNTKLSTKLFIDITQRCFDLMKPNGIMQFITPRSILLNTGTNKVYDRLKKSLTVVDFTADDNFDIGQSVIWWEMVNDYSNNVKVITTNRTYIANSIDAVTDSNPNILSAFHKLWGRSNKKKVIKFNKDPLQVNDKDVVEMKEIEDGYVRCLTHKKRDNPAIKKSLLPKGEHKNRLLLYYVGRWKEGAVISNKPRVGDFFCISDTDNRLKNIKTYIDSKPMMFMVRYFSEVLAPRSTNNAGMYIPAVDFDKSWTDKDVYKEFNLTKEEIKAVEEWHRDV